ncbi:MAG: ABC transporter substrate-binding protein [Alphaproteobacteria bacterium]|nr:ABC transporter substrate-binding protein [Alphaproteobacteria bacterium]MCB9696448.1 ABC transporter substrate-binding protein [Alphaproteobacteria bacterium]
MEVTLAVSPDADDLFMVRALLEGALDTGPYTFRISSSPTDALNTIASGEAGPDVVAVSIAHWPRIAARYQLLPHGGSMGEGYGPVVVAHPGGPARLEDLAGRRLAVPGLTTTAWLALRLLRPDLGAEPVVVPIDPYQRVFDALDAGEVDAALLIHEGRLTYEDQGLVRLLELGEAWSALTGGLPLPLGGNVIRRDLPEEHKAAISELLRASIRHALDHRDQAIAWLLARGGALRTPERVSTYLSMYANERTADYGEQGREAIRDLLARAVAAGMLPDAGPVDFSP